MTAGYLTFLARVAQDAINRNNFVTVTDSACEYVNRHYVLQCAMSQGCKQVDQSDFKRDSESSNGDVVYIYLTTHSSIHTVINKRQITEGFLNLKPRIK